jgi:predicted RNase H-like HicB family nuclease
MLEKIPGRPLTNKLRVIHLLESDFNLMIGILWGRRLVRHGENNQVFHDGQGGSRPDRRTQELLIQKHCTYSIWRMARMNGASFDNDAKSCFDRIVMTLASLCSQQIGMPKNACELFLGTLSQMKYYIKTASGISEEFYSTTENHVMHGPGQGGRGSPSVWLLISSLLMKCMEEKASGAVMVNPINPQESINQRITGFVDDITHWYSTNHGKTPEEVVNEMKIAAQWWEQLLHASGGKVELSKCFYYIVYWIYDEEGIATMVDPKKISNQIEILDSETKQLVNIESKPSNEPHKTLGVMECPSGLYKEEFNRLIKKARGFAQRLATTTITQQAARVLYQSMYIPSMSYSLTVGTFSIEQCVKIQGIATQQFLATMGYNRNTPSRIAYGPREFGGIGLQHLFAIQGSEKVCFLLRMLRTNRPASKILSIQLAWAQIISGISTNILQNTTTHLPQLCEESWITTLRQFLAVSELQIYINTKQVDERQRQYDWYIMDRAHGEKLG